MIEGYLSKVTPIFGEGPVDSLMNALALVKKFHDEVREIVPGAKSRRAEKKLPKQKTGRVATPSKGQRKRSRLSSRKNSGGAKPPRL